MDQEIEMRSDQEVKSADNTRGDAREFPLDNAPLHKLALSDSGSSRSLPKNRGDDSLIYKMPLRGVESEPRPRSRRSTSIDCLALKSTRLFEKDGTDESFGLRQRKGALRHVAKRRKSRSPDAPRRRESHQRAPHQLRPRARWLIPAEHTFKVIWDIVTVILSLANAYATHVSIRDRKFGDTPFHFFCNVWFLVDILLNFVTERKTVEGVILRDYRSIAARYLTSWFAVDALSLFPWETLYVKPIIDLQNRRGFFRKSFFRSKGIVRVTTHLRGKHFRWFGTVARRAKGHGIGASRLLRLLIKYLPKYILFLRNMKGVVAMRVLRQINYVRRFYTNIVVGEKGDAMTVSLTRHDEFEDDLSSIMSFGDSRRVQVVYESWELVDDDDGVPL